MTRSPRRIVQKSSGTSNTYLEAFARNGNSGMNPTTIDVTRRIDVPYADLIIPSGAASPSEMTWLVTTLLVCSAMAPLSPAMHAGTLALAMMLLAATSFSERRCKMGRSVDCVRRSGATLEFLRAGRVQYAVVAAQVKLESQLVDVRVSVNRRVTRSLIILLIPGAWLGVLSLPVPCELCSIDEVASRRLAWSEMLGTSAR